MILSGQEILKEYSAGHIYIDDFDMKRLNPNSYNLRLHNELLIYGTGVLNMKVPNETTKIPIPEAGLLLLPNMLYLGRTMVRTRTDCFVPMLEGRSSVGRLGISIHETAGFGDVGFDGYWTLEISCIQPVIIYPGVEICQIYYHTIQGAYEKYGKSGKYQGNTDIQPSMMWKDFERHERPEFMSQVLGKFEASKEGKPPKDYEDVEDNDPWETKSCIAAGR